MPRQVIKRIETQNGALDLIQDESDSQDRWFVEAWTQLAFDNEHQARLRFEAIQSPQSETSRDPWHGDIGQVDVSPYRCELRLRARGAGGEVWTLVVKPNWTGAQLLLDEAPVPLSSFTAVVAYMLMRAICRGIDKSEVRESKTVVFIDMGVIPALPPRPLQREQL
jgi:hypothetical protein